MDPEVRKRIEELCTKGHEILDRAREEKRELKGEETQQLAVITAELRGFNLQIGGPGGEDFRTVADWFSKAKGEPIKPEIEGTRSTTARNPIRLEINGQEVRAIGPGESLAEACRDYPLIDGIKPSEFSYGKLIAGHVTGNWKGRELEQRVMGEQTGASGGFVIRPPYSLPLLDKARNATRMIQAGANVFTIDTAEADMAIVTEDPTAQWLAEHATLSESDMTLQKGHFEAKKCGVMCRPSVELVEDSNNIADVIENGHAASLGLAMDSAFLMGSGVGTPLGLYTQGGVQEIVGIGALTDYSDFSKAWGMIQQENGPDAGLSVIMNPRERQTLDALEDTTGQPLRPPESWGSMQKFSTNQIPVTLGAGENESVAFVGAFGMYYIAMRTGVTIESARLADSDSVKKFQVVIRSYIRVDGFAVRPPWFLRMKEITA